MIIAEIGHDKYALESLEDAEALIKIISRAKPIDSGYDRSISRYYYESPTGIAEMSISVVNAEILTYEQHTQIREERRKAEDEEAGKIVTEKGEA